jgi:tRNA threonylcarbamoyladenosine biosynthesis protein TsaE
LYSDHLCLVEWPERAPSIFPPGSLHIYLDLIDSATRRLRIGGN